MKTSPILTSSANTSPTSFRHAPSSRTAPPSAASSVPASSPVLRRPVSRSASPASGSMKSPQSLRSRRQQSSTVNAEDAVARSASSSSIPVEPPPAPRPEPFGKAPATLTSTSTSPAPTSAPQNAAEALSPNKRRGSPAEKAQEAPLQNSGPVSTEESSAQASKRAKPDEQPPKVLPNQYELCDVEDMVILIAHMLAELIATNDAIRISNGGLTRFHSR